MHTITLLSASGDARETVEALVDTGATFTSVAASCWIALVLRMRVQSGYSWPMGR